MVDVLLMCVLYENDTGGTQDHIKEWAELIKPIFLSHIIKVIFR